MIATMNNRLPKGLLKLEAMHDKQSEPDHRRLRIDKVGVRGLRFPIQIRDKDERRKTPSPPSACLSICPRNSRAPHEPLQSSAQFPRPRRPLESITDILYAMQAKLKSAVAHLEMEFRFSW